MRTILIEPQSRENRPPPAREASPLFNSDSGCERALAGRAVKKSEQTLYNGREPASLPSWQALRIHRLVAAMEWDGERTRRLERFHSPANSRTGGRLPAGTGDSSWRKKKHS